MVALERADLAQTAHGGRNTLGCGARGGERSKVGNLILNRGLADAAVVGASIAATRRRIDDELNLAVLNRVENVGATLADLSDNRAFDSVLL